KLVTGVQTCALPISSLAHRWLESMRTAICPTAHLELAEKVIDISFNRLIDAIRVVPQVKQFELRIAKRPGLPSEIASALWQKGVHIQAFSAQLQEGQEIFHLAVDKAQKKLGCAPLSARERK